MDSTTSPAQRPQILDLARARAHLMRETRGGARSVALALLEVTAANGQAETSARVLAETLGGHARNVRQHVAVLRAEGWLEVAHRGPTAAIYTWSREKLADAWTSGGLRIVRPLDDVSANSRSSKPLLSRAVIRAYETARDTVHPEAQGVRIDAPRTDEDAANLERVAELLAQEEATPGEQLPAAVERVMTRAFVAYMRNPQHAALRSRHHPLPFAAEDADRLLVYGRRSRSRAAAAPPPLVPGNSRTSGFQEVLRAVGGVR